MTNEFTEDEDQEEKEMLEGLTQEDIDIGQEMYQSLKDKEKRKRFVTFAERRTDKALQAINSIGHLHNRDYYQYSEDDIKDIFSVLNKAIKDAQQKFSNTPDKGSFKLKNRDI